MVEKKKKFEKTNEALKIATINLSEKQIEFFDKLKKMGLTASRSEALRLCVNISMSYFMNMMAFLKDPFTGGLEEKVKAIVEKIVVDEEYVKQTVKKLEYTRKKGIKNIFWEKQFVNGKLMNVPVEPDSDEDLIYLEEYGYVPISRLEDLEINEDQKLKELVRAVLNTKNKKPKQKDPKKNPYNNIIANSTRNKNWFQGGM